jgi:2-oxoglutarate ferredoxin oxidoreductase subunit alpha
MGKAAEIAASSGVPVVLNPFPGARVRAALEGSRRVIVVEQNATGQLERILPGQSIRIDGRIRKYDGRPFAQDELESRVREVLP